MKRLVVKIDEEKCDGCGLCVPSCAEGALRIVEGKARLVSDALCDGLGACLGECPQGALIVEEREAPAFDEEAVAMHLADIGRPAPVHAAAHAVAAAPARPLPQTQAAPAHGGGCPGSRAITITREPESARQSAAKSPSHLTQWPVQMTLLPLRAPYYQGANLLLCADCVPFAYPDFHRDLLQGNVVAVGCPKLDDPQFYVEKLSKILAENDVRGVTVAHMEVPCCFGLVRVVREAMQLAGKNLPVRDLTITVEGRAIEKQ